MGRGHATLEFVLVRQTVPSSVRPSISLSVRPSIYPSVRPSIRPSVHPSISPNVRLYARPSVVRSFRSYISSFIRMSVRLSHFSKTADNRKKKKGRHIVVGRKRTRLFAHPGVFLEASIRLYERFRPSVRQSVRMSVISFSIICCVSAHRCMAHRTVFFVLFLFFLFLSVFPYSYFRSYTLNNSSPQWKKNEK